MDGLNTPELQKFFDSAFPPGAARVFTIEDARPHFARVRMRYAARFLRPGGTISGPAQMTLVDTAMWMAVGATMGENAKQAVTSNMNMAFLRRPKQADLIGEAQILRFGRTLAYGEVKIWSDGDDTPVAHATCTYALPRAAIAPEATTASPEATTASPEATTAPEAST